MALQKCHECEKEVSSDAVACPGCGAPVKGVGKKKGGCLGTLAKAFLALMAISIIFGVLGSFFRSDKGNEGASSPGGKEVPAKLEPVNQKRLTADQFGDTWPLTVKSGVVKCLRGGAVVIEVNGMTYGVNGVAKSMGHADIEPIWETDNSYVDMAKEIAGAEGRSLDSVLQEMGTLPRKSIQPILSSGLELCP